MRSIRPTQASSGNHQSRGGVGPVRLGEAWLVAGQLGQFPDRQPGKAAANLPGADERPAAIARQALPRDVDALHASFALVVTGMG